MAGIVASNRRIQKAVLLLTPTDANPKARASSRPRILVFLGSRAAWKPRHPRSLFVLPREYADKLVIRLGRYSQSSVIRTLRSGAMASNYVNRSLFLYAFVYFTERRRRRSGATQQTGWFQLTSAANIIIVLM